MTEAAMFISWYSRLSYYLAVLSKQYVLFVTGLCWLWFAAVWVLILMIHWSSMIRFADPLDIERMLIVKSITWSSSVCPLQHSIQYTLKKHSTQYPLISFAWSSMLLQYLPFKFRDLPLSFFRKYTALATV